MRVAALADVTASAGPRGGARRGRARRRLTSSSSAAISPGARSRSETLELGRALATPARFVRGNADRRSERDEATAASGWRAAHGGGRRVPDGVRADRARRGRRARRDCFSHGSPRRDEECVTERTPEERVREFMAGVDERRRHGARPRQYDRVVDGTRLVGPGSVGLPYEGRAGRAYWALLGPDVELRRTEYDIEDGGGAHARDGRSARRADRRTHA